MSNYFITLGHPPYLFNYFLAKVLIIHDTVIGAKNEFYLKIGKMYPFLSEIIGKVFRLHVAVDSLEIGGYLLKSLVML